MDRNAITRPDLPKSIPPQRIRVQTKTDFPAIQPHEYIPMPKMEKLYDTSYRIINK